MPLHQANPGIGRQFFRIQGALETHNTSSNDGQVSPCKKSGLFPITYFYHFPQYLYIYFSSSRDQVSPFVWEYLLWKMTFVFCMWMMSR